MFTEATLRKLWPRGDSKIPGLVKGIVDAAPKEFAGWGDTELAQAMAQFSHECGAGLEMVENIHYTAQRATEVWPNRFKTAAECYEKVGSFPGDPDFPIKLIDSVYGNRMGNRPGTHDGSTFIGRGLSQCTGRENYEKLGNKTGLDLLKHPEFLSDPRYALKCGVADFIMCGCLPYAKVDDTLMVTKRLNGGTVGLELRKQWLVRWKRALLEQGPYTPPVPKPVAPAPPPSAALPKKTAAGGAVIAGSIAAATQFNSWYIIAGVIAAGVGIAIALHFLWKKPEVKQ